VDIFNGDLQRHKCVEDPIILSCDSNGKGQGKTEVDIEKKQ
jgi:hypothetical protein